MVIYKSLYNNKIWIRPEKSFFDVISERPDNITGQKYRFELVKEIEKTIL